MANFDYDVIIIWAWSAGYPASIYASRFWLKNLIIWAQPWWALATSHKVENFPGIISASGAEIMNNFKEHALASWWEIIDDTVTELNKVENYFEVKTSFWKFFTTKYVILATGNSYRKLWAKWEQEFLWKWVSYCATCDGMFFKNKVVIVVWWGNTAMTEALYLSNICKKVYLVHRSDKFRCDICWSNEADKKENIEILKFEEVEEIVWDLFWMTWVKLKSGKNLEADWIFVAVWTLPNTQLVDKFNPEKDSEWCLVVDKKQETSISWIFAAWDITTNSNKVRQTLTSAAEWAVASSSVHEEIMKG